MYRLLDLRNRAVDHIEAEHIPAERTSLTEEKRKLVVDIVSVSCIALIFVIGASLIGKIAIGSRRRREQGKC